MNAPFLTPGMAESNGADKMNHALTIDKSQLPADIAPASSQLTPMQMAYQLITNGADLGSVKEMLAMSRELAAEQAKRAFDNAISEAKAELRPIVKNRDGHNSKYADFAAVSTSVDPVLSNHGLSYRHRSAQPENKVSVTCILSHKDGHSEETTLSSAPDTSGAKNSIQAIGSALTYLQRYTLLLALGLATTADDDNGVAAGADLINDEQRNRILKLIDSTSADTERFCRFFKIDAVPALPSKRFDEAVKMLEGKRGAK